MKLSRYRPGQTLGSVQEVEAYIIHRESANDGGKVVRPTYRPSFIPPLPQILILLISVRDWVGPRAILWPEGIIRMNFSFIILCNLYRWYGPGSSVGIATDYRLDGLESNSGGDEFFRPSRPVLGLTQPPIKWVPGLSLGVEAVGAWGWPPAAIKIAEVLERVELYLYSP